MKYLAPICLFTYNRLDQTIQTVTALQKNYLAKDSHLIIFSDGAKSSKDVPKVLSVREYIKTIEGFKSVEIIESLENKGLANSIISGVTEVIKEYGKVIVLEDDLITTPNFLDFMNQSLFFYKDILDVESVNGFSLELNMKELCSYFQVRPFPWGWGTWLDRWEKVVFDKNKIQLILDSSPHLLIDFKRVCGDDVIRMLKDSLSGLNNSWYIRWTFHHFINKKYSLYPLSSFVRNEGFGEEGTHCKTINPYNYKLNNGENRLFHFDKRVYLETNNRSKFLKYFSKSYRIIIRLKLLTSFEGISLLYRDIKSKMF